jgi:DNA-binding NarL/FixJ family response regulator/predicted Ser/Thr protein kinase
MSSRCSTIYNADRNSRPLPGSLPGPSSATNYKSQKDKASLMSTTKEITIFIAEDHLIARMGLKMLLEQTAHFSVVGEAEDGETAVEMILDLKPEVVMMDLGLPKIDGVEATAKIKKQLPQTKILIFTSAEDDESIFSALRAGADGYCLKTISGEMLANAIQSVLKGAAWLDPGIANKVLRAQTSAPTEQKTVLTESKIQLLSLVEQGKSLDEIASEMNVNDGLVKGLLKELLSQLKGSPEENKEQADDANTLVSASPVVSIRPGDVIAEHYKIEERIGHGGMGSVFQARHTFIERKVAIKTLHEHLTSDPSTLARFKAEAQANASVEHPNLVRIYDFGVIQGRVPYIVMEFLDGYSLEDMIKELGRLDDSLGKHIFSQVAKALSAVHARGIVHRDLKPSNIMIVESENDNYFVKLVDFGIAKVLDNGGEALTQAGEALGSPPYMSPEQCYAAELDHRSDLYSLGCTMYEAFSGCRVFPGSTAIEVMMKHVNDKPSREPLDEAKVDRRVADLILSLLEKKPKKRPESAGLVRDKLLSK